MEASQGRSQETPLPLGQEKQYLLSLEEEMEAVPQQMPSVFPRKGTGGVGTAWEQGRPTTEGRGDGSRRSQSSGEVGRCKCTQSSAQLTFFQNT